MLADMQGIYAQTNKRLTTAKQMFKVNDCKVLSKLENCL